VKVQKIAGWILWVYEWFRPRWLVFSLY
jgi:hypothetical protein